MATPTLPETQQPAEGAPLLLIPKTASRFLGVSRRKFFDLRKLPGFPAPVSIPTSSLPYYRRSDLEEWVRSLTPAQPAGER